MTSSILVSDAEYECVVKDFERWRNVFVNYPGMVGYKTVDEFQACFHGSDGVYLDMKMMRREVDKTSVMDRWVHEQTGAGCSCGWAKAINMVAAQRDVEPMGLFQELLLSLCERLEEGGKAFLEDLLNPLNL